MITLTILLVLAVIILVPILLVGSVGIWSILIIFGDVILALLIIVGIIKKLFFNKKDK